MDTRPDFELTQNQPDEPNEHLKTRQVGHRGTNVIIFIKSSMIDNHKCEIIFIKQHNSVKKN